MSASDIPNEHPAGARLDALAVGQGDTATEAHVASCASCTKYVQDLTRGAALFAKDDAKVANFVAAVRERSATRSRPWMAYAGSVLALAACLLLWMNHEKEAVSVPGVAPSLSETRFKGGGLQVAVVVEHQGAQSRRTGPLELEPGDRIRLEIALDHDEILAAGVLSDQGEWAELQASALMAGGTHYSEQSIAFDGDVPSGVVLVGPAEAVNTARANRNYESVVAIPLRAKGR